MIFFFLEMNKFAIIFAILALQILTSDAILIKKGKNNIGFQPSNNVIYKLKSQPKLYPSNFWAKIFKRDFNYFDQEYEEPKLKWYEPEDENHSGDYFEFYDSNIILKK